MPLRVLFVDDETNILDGLRRMLRPLRNEWQMQFASSGADALALMATEPVDVLVTDMRMPGMDGDELLAEVRRLHPLTVRIVLSGQCTRQATLRLVRSAHRVFTKPCDPDTLKTAVHRVCALQDLLRSEPLVALVGQLGSLPTPPALYNQIIAEFEKPDGSLSEVGAMIAQDVGMAAKLMQMANSSLLGLRNQVASPIQAVQVLGTETTKAMVLVAEVLTQYDPAAIQPYSIDGLWDHSREATVLAGSIAQTESNRVQAADARLVGLLHDIGRLTLVSQRPDQYRQVFRLMSDENLSVVDAERSVFGSTHAEVGAYLLGLWGLPNLVVEAVAWHHMPSGCPADTFGPLTAIHAAEAILAPNESGPADIAYLTRLGMVDRLIVWSKLRDQMTTGSIA